jgi:hypothetical protein
MITPITPVFGSLPRSEALRHQAQRPNGLPELEIQDPANPNPVEQNDAAIPGILQGVQRIVQERRQAHERLANPVRFGMEEDRTPPQPIRPRPEAHQAPGPVARQRPANNGNPFANRNLLPLFNLMAQEAAQPAPSSSNQSTQTHHSPSKSTNS